jgi:5-bromo-4-chloroindolyl phosphate hydrolysis protein
MESEIYASIHGKVILVTDTKDSPKDALLFWPSQKNSRQVLLKQRETTAKNIKLIRERFQAIRKRP